MANTIKTSYGEGGAQLTPGASGTPDLATVLRGIADDLAALRAAHTALTAKMDLDPTIVATDWASTCNPPAMITVKG